MKRLLFLIFLLIASRASALIDSNQNGISDPAERHLNQGQLLAAGTDVHAKLAGGWSLSEIATAGLSPDDATGGILRIEGSYIPPVFHQDSGGNQQILTPAAYTLTFLAAAGKSYAIEVSQDLSAGSWTTIDQFIGAGAPITQGITLTQPDGSLPGKLFFRVQINDIDSDFDGLLDVEEIELGTDPNYAWSDSDYLSDGEEVLRYHTDPLNPMSDGVTLDHEKVLGLGEGGEIASSYAPEVHLLNASRSLSYHFVDYSGGSEMDYGDINTAGDWDENLYRYTALTEPISLGDLAQRLATEFPYPGHPTLPRYSWSDVFGVNAFTVRDPDSTVHWATINQSKVWLHLTTPGKRPTTRTVLFLSYSQPLPGLPAELLNILPISFEVPAGKYDSNPQEFGNEGAELIRYGGLVEFAPFQPFSIDELGWDATGNEPWQCLAVGDTKDFRVNFAAGLPQEVADRLEIAIPSESEKAFLQISEQDLTGPNGSTFKLTGVKESPKQGVAVVVRLKDDPNMVFASMRVDVNLRRLIKVAIYRWQDSRIPATALVAPPGQTILDDQAIINALNDVYYTQGNLAFARHPQSRTINVATDVPGAPQLFDADGTFSTGRSAWDAWSYTDGLPLPENVRHQKLSIHIVQHFKGPKADSIAATNDKFKYSFISATEVGDTYAHEIGHSFRAAAESDNDPDGHDYGPWPVEWTSSRKTGLMHPYANDSNKWIRQEDWEKIIAEIIKSSLAEPTLSNPHP